jgi:hypothetical protein
MRHARVLSDNAARQAEAETDVQTFRAEMLGGCLLSDDAASEWIQSRTGRFEGLQSLVAFQCGGELRRAPVAGSAALERLKRLVDALAERYRWPEDAATIFLLTGRTPLRLPSVTLRASSHHGQKILVEADPWVPPGVVRDAYAAARDSLTPQPRRVPRISPKRRELVAFVNARGGVPSRALFIDWNNEHPQWRYQDGANFIRDYHRTVERM